MRKGIWGKLDLRWQAALAVLLPCMLVALFAAVYFPARSNDQAAQALSSRAQSLGSLAARQLGVSLQSIERGEETDERLDDVLLGLAENDELGFVGIVRLPPGVAAATGPAQVRVSQPGDLRRGGVSYAGRQLPAPPNGEYLVPPLGCATQEGGQLITVTCRIRGEPSPGVLVAGFSRADLRAKQSENQQLGWILLAAAAGLGSFLALLFSRALTRPVALVTQAARVLASGDVTVASLQVSGAGQVQSMAHSFNEMLGSLRGLVTQMVSLTGRLSQASAGLLDASRDQDHVTSQQAAYAQQIAATFEELSRTAEKISSSTVVVEQAARRTYEAVGEARAVVSNVVGEITQIRHESKEVAEAILRLNQDLQQVSTMAGVINQVAERSDLLALNAALEGTKAGEIGRGFSLVAAEMRKLAESVSHSSRDIGRLVERIQESGSEAVEKAQVGVAASDKGVTAAEQASAVFERIAELALGTTDAAQQISVATRQQRQSSEHAVQGARNVTDLMKQGVDATGRTNRIAQDLQGVCQALAEVTGRFKVNDERPLT